MATTPVSSLPGPLPMVLAGAPAGAATNVQLLKTSTFLWNVGIGTTQILKTSTFRWNIEFITRWTKIN